MPKYQLQEIERATIVNKLFEPGGYLDSAQLNSSGESATDKLLADPLFDVLGWIRTNGDNAYTDPELVDETKMMWWIWKNDGATVTTVTAPPEKAGWVTKLNGFIQGIHDAFQLVGEWARNVNSKPLYDDQRLLADTLPNGLELHEQQRALAKARAVLNAV